MANPIIPQGALNRLRTSITFTTSPNLNVSASYLGKEMVSISFDGVATTPIETATGLVQSPEPYQRVTIAAHLLKTQALANAFKQQIELNTLLGDLVLRLDAASLDPYQISNSSIQTVNPIKGDGTDGGWVVMMSGIYYINSNLWNI